MCQDCFVLCLQNSTLCPLLSIPSADSPESHSDLEDVLASF